MRAIYVFLLALFILNSCNLVKWKENNSTKKLAKNHVLSTSMDQDSLHINYWTGGDGPVLVFIHGFGGDALMTWEKELSHFSKNHTVIAMDILWFGESYSNQPANLETQTAAIDVLLNNLMVDSATIVGQSYGGFIALDYATKHPEKVEKLIIANSPGSTFNINELQTVCTNFGVKSIDELFVFDDYQNVQRLVDLSSYKNPRIPSSILKQSYELYFNQHHNQLRELMRTLPGEQERLMDISMITKIPTLVLWGEKDEIFSEPEGIKFAKAVGAKFVSIPKCGHAPQIDNPKEFLRILDEFIMN